MGCGSSKKIKPPPSKPSNIVNNPSNPPPAPPSSSYSAFSKFSLGAYEVQSQILKIPYSVLYNAKQVSADLMRSLKVVDLSTTEGVSLNPKHLESEIKQLKSLDHINILKIHDMFPLENKFCIAMEPLNETIMLFDFITSLVTLKESNVAKVVSQILSAVSYCHSQKVIHRDLNPKLIFVTNRESFHVKISEFGSSAFMDPENKLVGKSFPKIFTAPEVFENFYNEKCDLWSVGVIMCLMLTGGLPGPEGELSKVEGVNEGAVDLMKKLLKKDFKLRISAAEALKHPWLTLNQNENSSEISQALLTLKEFTKDSIAQDSVREFIATQIISYNDTQYFIENFQKLDSNNDGKITKEELTEHYSKSMSPQDAKIKVDNIFEVADRNKNGSLEFGEFVKGTMKKSSLLSLNNIETAFKLLDKDNNHYLSVEELQFLLGESADKTIRQVILEADVNNDGQISFSEFYMLLKKKYS